MKCIFMHAMASIIEHRVRRRLLKIMLAILTGWVYSIGMEDMEMTYRMQLIIRNRIRSVLTWIPRHIGYILHPEQHPRVGA